MDKREAHRNTQRGTEWDKGPIAIYANRKAHLLDCPSTPCQHASPLSRSSIIFYSNFGFWFLAFCYFLIFIYIFFVGFIFSLHPSELWCAIFFSFILFIFILSSLFWFEFIVFWNLLRCVPSNFSLLFFIYLESIHFSSFFVATHFFSSSFFIHCLFRLNLPLPFDYFSFFLSSSSLIF